MSKFFKIQFLLLLAIIIPRVILSQNIDSINISNDTIFTDSTAIIFNDSLINPLDSILPDTLSLNDTLSSNSSTKKSNAIDDIIDFSANDSMYISVYDKNIILFGKGVLTTVGMDLSADSIGIDMDKKELEAKGMINDTTGRISGNPIFSDQDQDYSSTLMRYNFNTKKGIIHDVVTQQQDGFLHGQIVKIHSNDEMHIYQGKYTTCDHPHPHYYIDLTKAKLKSKDKIITGPLYFVILDIPFPIAAPFGFFPISHANSSGIHFPTFSEEIERGIGLTDFGYYWAINDYVDVDFLADVYTKGSWGINLKSNLKKRYLFSSSVDLSFFHYQNGERILSTTDVHNSFSARVSFNQDPKALPKSRLSATVNFVKGNIQQYNANDIDQFVNTTTNSSISFQRSFDLSLLTLSMSSNLNLSQNLADSTNSLRFPVFNLSTSKIFPFKPQNKPARGAWYEKIGFDVKTQFTNSVTAHDSVFYNHQDSLFRIMKTGFKYDVPLQTSFTMLKYFNFSPSFNLHGRIYPYKIEKYSAGTQDSLYILNDTVWGFNNVYDFDTRLSVSTKVFGLFKLNIGRLKAIRHVISPSLTYTYKPDFGQTQWGYYDDNPLDSTKQYSYYDGAVYGIVQQGEQQKLSFSLGNNFEAKVAAGKDSTQQEKKIKLIESLGISANYNFAADSLNLSNIGFNGSLKPISKLSVNFSGSFDPYAVDFKGRKINTFQFEVDKKLARLTTATLSLNSSFGSADFRKKGSSSKGIEWSTSVVYNFRFNKTFNQENQEFDIKLSQTATVNYRISPTPLWSISVRTGYDFDALQVTSTTFNFYRNLHCWEMSLQVTPFGKMRSYMFKINIKSSMFEAVKIEKKRSWHDNL